jgi:rSAM/selenodomain-associated transferase 1
MHARKLIIFVKAPRPGLVKTRLAAEIGATAACLAYRRLVETLFLRLTRLTEVELRYSPEDGLAEVRAWAGSKWECRPQGAGDLGQRLCAAFTDAFNAGVERVVIIGSDCPAIEAEDIEDAWRSLSAHDVVLGPAQDGGYWLVGLRKPQPILFENLTWSTDKVLEETLNRIHQAGLSVYLSRTLRDVDTEQDWREFLASRIAMES